MAYGGVAKRLNAADCKSAPPGFGGSKPSPSTMKETRLADMRSAGFFFVDSCRFYHNIKQEVSFQKKAKAVDTTAKTSRPHEVDTI